MLSFIRIVVLIFAASAIIPATGCTKKNEDEKVRTVIESARKAAEDRDVKKVLSYIDPAYHDGQGKDYEAVKSIFLYYFFRHQKIGIIITNLEITVDGTTATSSFQAILSGRSGGSGDILPETLGAYRFNVMLKKSHDDWKIVSSEWERWSEASPNAARNTQ